DTPEFTRTARHCDEVRSADRSDEFPKCKNRADFGAPRIASPDFQWIGYHGTHFFGGSFLVVTDKNCIVVGFRHFATIGPGDFGRLGERGFGFDENFSAVSVEVIKTAYDFATEFQMGDLIAPDRYKLTFNDRYIT